MWGQPAYPRPPGLLRTLAKFVLLVELAAWLLFGGMTWQVHLAAAEGLRHAGQQHAATAGGRGLALGSLFGGGSSPDPAPSSRAARAVRWALAQRGKPYQWGQAGPSSFDCSGLTSAAWQAAGVTIPRTAAGQLAGLPRVHGKRRPGDLIVYETTGPSKRHVAMVVDRGRMVEARGEGSPVEVVPVRGGALGTVRPGGR